MRCLWRVESPTYIFLIRVAERLRYCADTCIVSRGVQSAPFCKPPKCFFKLYSKFFQKNPIIPDPSATLSARDAMRS